MNKIRHACFMIGEDLGITGLEAIRDFPEEDPVAQIIFMQELLSKLEEKDPKKYERRLEYIKSIKIVK